MRERYHSTMAKSLISLHFCRKNKIRFVFCTICCIFAPRNIVDRATAFCTTHKIANRMRHGKTAVSSHSIMGVGFSGIHLCRGVWRYL